MCATSEEKPQLVHWGDNPGRQVAQYHFSSFPSSEVKEVLFSDDHFSIPSDDHFSIPQ